MTKTKDTAFDEAYYDEAYFETGNKEINKRYSVFTNDRGETRKTLVDAITFWKRLLLKE